MITWIGNVLAAALQKKAPRHAKDIKLSSDLPNVLWVLEYPGEKHPDIPYTDAELTPDFVRAVLQPYLDFVDARYDCFDFRLLFLLKFKLSAGSFLKANPDIEVLLKQTFLGAKFTLWQSDAEKAVVSEGGRSSVDSVCYYSENHQLSFAVAEHLIGTLYPNDVFAVDGKTGQEHVKAAAARMRTWFSLREQFDVSEFYSGNYQPINLAILAMIIRYVRDERLVEAAKEMTDVILYDYAATTFEGTFVNASGRAYPRNNLYTSYSEPNSQMVMEAVWGSAKKTKSFIGHTAWLFTAMMLARDEYGEPYYTVPSEIVNLAHETEHEEKKAFGLSLCDYPEAGLCDGDERSLMMQLGSGALTNPEVIDQTLGLFHGNHLERNDFLYWLWALESPLLYRLGLMPAASRFFQYFPNGMALERADVYTHRTSYWKLSCAQHYRPGSSGAQQTVMAVTLPGKQADGAPQATVVYTNHPLRSFEGGNNGGQFGADRSPSYFGGYGIAPDACADGSVCMMIYRIPFVRRVLQPFRMLPYTHTFFPEEWMDDVVINGRYAFGRVGESFIAVIGKNPLERRPFNPAVAVSAQGKLQNKNKSFDLVQHGRNTYWIYELSDGSKEAFDEFIARVTAAEIVERGRTVVYRSTSEYRLTYGGVMCVDGRIVDTHYE